MSCLQLLLEESGILHSLEVGKQAAKAKRNVELESQLSNRIDNLQLLREMARRAESESTPSGDLLDPSDRVCLDPDSFAGASNRPVPGKQRLELFASYCALMGDGDERPDDPRVSVLTAHASKGKEYSHVIFHGCCDGVVPMWNATHYPDDLEQERNTAYVAATRAKDHLIITWPRLSHRGYKQKPSRFLNLSE